MSSLSALDNVVVSSLCRNIALGCRVSSLLVLDNVVLQGELAATAVNAPMVPAEVMAELQPFVALSQGLGKAAVQLVRDTGFTDIKITYASPRYASLAQTPRSHTPEFYVMLHLHKCQDRTRQP